MRQVIFIVFFTCAGSFASAQVNYIRTIAGNDTGGYGGDNGPAIDAKLYFPEGVFLDKWDNVYIADALNARIRKIDAATSIITTVAGIDTNGYSGDSGLAVSAKLSFPEALFFDTSGNMYIADAGNNRIRKIATTGIITTIAGNGISGGAGDSGLAVNAELHAPSGLCIDKYGNIYIADNLNNKVRKVSAESGIITTFAGTGGFGYSGDNGPAINASFNGIVQVFADSSANIFIADQWNHVVRKVSALTGIVTTIAGTGVSGYSGDYTLAVHAQLNQPLGIYVDLENNIFIADYGNGAIRRIDGVTGIITTVAGNGVPGYSGDNGLATIAQLQPADIFFDSHGTMYIADYGNNRIRELYSPLNVQHSSKLEDASILPNPSSGRFVVRTATSNEQIDVVIFNVSGEKIQESSFITSKGEIDISEQPDGVYLVQLTNVTTGVTVMRKIVKK